MYTGEEMPLGVSPGSCGKRLQKCDINLEKMKSDLIEGTTHLLALQQLYRLVIIIFLYVGADVGRLGTKS